MQKLINIKSHRESLEKHLAYHGEIDALAISIPELSESVKSLSEALEDRENSLRVNRLDRQQVGKKLSMLQENLKDAGQYPWLDKTISLYHLVDEIGRTIGTTERKTLDGLTKIVEEMKRKHYVTASSISTIKELKEDLRYLSIDRKAVENEAYLLNENILERMGIPKQAPETYKVSPIAYGTLIMTLDTYLKKDKELISRNTRKLWQKIYGTRHAVEGYFAEEISARPPKFILDFYKDLFSLQALDIRRDADGAARKDLQTLKEIAQAMLEYTGLDKLGYVGLIERNLFDTDIIGRVKTSAETLIRESRQ